MNMRNHLPIQRPEACVVSVRSPDVSDLGQGWQWFGVQGVTEINRPARVAATMPRARCSCCIARRIV